MGRPFFVAYGFEQPSDGQTLLTRSIDLHGNLVAGTADTLAADFDVRLDVLDRLLEDFDRGLVVGFTTSGDFFQRVVENLLRDRFLSVQHQAIDELTGQERIMTRIALELLLACSNASHSTSWLRIGFGIVCDRPHPTRRDFRVRPGSEHPASLEHDLREPKRSSVPEGCGPLPGCRP